eukprot:392246_1
MALVTDNDTDYQNLNNGHESDNSMYKGYRPIDDTDDDGNNADYASLGAQQIVAVNTNPSQLSYDHTNIQQQRQPSPKPIQPIQVPPDANDSITDNLLALGTPSKPKSYAPWTPRGAQLYLQDKFQAGGIKGSVFTLIICIVGAGALSLPWAFRVSGLGLGIILLLLASTFTFLSLHFLVYASLYIKERP